MNFRTDIIEDTGSSLSPEIDIGQIEGAFTFGIGLWTSEEIKFHPLTGKILTYDTWVIFISEYLSKMFDWKFYKAVTFLALHDFNLI